MLKSFSQFLLSVTLAIVVIGVIATVYLTPAIAGQETQKNLGNSLILASNWDSINHSYNGSQEMTVYRSPSCGCCGLWVEHARKNGFKIKDIKTDNMASIKQKYQITSDLESCHTAIIDGYVMEGHIPADDLKRFLKEKPNMIGLSVPGMILGSPGMEAGDKKQPFAVFAFNKTGKIDVFKEYQSY